MIERRVRTALALVGIGYFCLNVFFVGVHFGLSHDEVTYLSQVNPSVPNFDWSAWRAWGMPVLFAPIAVWSPGLGAVRLYASLLSSVGLVAAFWPWVRVLRSYAVPLAALLFSTGWIAVYYGNDVQPNLYVALGAVGVVGLFLRAVEDRDDRRLLVVLAFVAFLVALIRPSDGLLVAGPLGLACLVARPLRRPTLIVPLGVGVVLGWLPWIVEAFVKFGGPISRYRISNAHEAVGGLKLNIDTGDIYLRLLDGPFYGYQQSFAAIGAISPVWVAFAVVFLLLAMVGVVTARRQRQFPALAMACASAAMLVLFYVFLLRYGGTRFLLPILGLLSLPVAAALVWFTQRRSRTIAVVAGFGVFALVSSNIGVQLSVANKWVSKDRPVREAFLRMGVALRQYGVDKPCIVLGSMDPPPTAYWAGCQAGQQSTEAGSLGQPLIDDVSQALAQGNRVVVVTRAKRLGPYFSSWRKVTFPHSPDRSIRAWISPDVRVSSR